MMSDISGINHKVKYRDRRVDGNGEILRDRCTTERWIGIPWLYQASLRDATRWRIPIRWVKTHGYDRSVAPRQRKDTQFKGYGMTIDSGNQKSIGETDNHKTTIIGNHASPHREALIPSRVATIDCSRGFKPTDNERPEMLRRVAPLDRGVRYFPKRSTHR